MRYAYLIIANRNFLQLQKLIKMLDDSRNDIYIMIDKKSNVDNLKLSTNYSGLFFVKPINIYWGGYSQIEAELSLFDAASSEHYTYYHLLSGLDLPLTNQDKIHEFFDHHLNNEFITYGNPKNLTNIDLRIKPHLFRKHYRNNGNLWQFYRKSERFILKHIKQNKIKKYLIGYGSQWVTIDDSLVQLIVKSTNLIHDIFHKGTLVDELFIPTLINLYPQFKEKVYYKEPVHNNPKEFQGNLRYINWWDGAPYVWRLKDYNTLFNAYKMGHLFSRKFDSNIDNKIIDKIFHNVME